jgi:hypothetical protein
MIITSEGRTYTVETERELCHLLQILRTQGPIGAWRWRIA